MSRNRHLYVPKRPETREGSPYFKPSRFRDVLNLSSPVRVVLNLRKMVGKWLENGWKMVGKWLENCWKIVGKLLEMVGT